MNAQFRPLIGITADRDNEAGDPESTYFLRRNYCDAVLRAGGTPIILPYDVESVDQLIQVLDGVVITGGMFDINPEFYNGPVMDGGVLKEDRTAFELALLNQALEKDIPVLGICGGMQLIGVALGAGLIQDLPKEYPGSLEHMQSHSCTQPQHDIAIETESRLHDALQSVLVRVNSLHHQALKDVIAPLHVVARSEDGVVEAVESVAHRFCIGTQWHPEYKVDPREAAIFEALVAAARRSQ